MREENARLQGELAGRQASPPSRPAPAAAPATVDEMTVEQLEQARGQIEAKIDAGELSAARGASLLGDIAAVKRDKLREQREAVTAPQREAERQLGDWIGKHPDLKRPGSELLGKVAAELPAIERMTGFSRDDPRAQVLAVERVVGGYRLGGGGGVTDFRRRVPVGGAGSGPAGGEERSTRQPDPLAEVERLYPDQVAYWNKLGLSEADRKIEAPLVLTRRARRARTA